MNLDHSTLARSGSSIQYQNRFLFSSCNINENEGKSSFKIAVDIIVNYLGNHARTGESQSGQLNDGFEPLGLYITIN